MVFNPNMDTRLSSPQIIGATGPVQTAAPSGTAAAMGAIAGLAKGFGDAWIDHKASEAAAAKAGAPSYAEESDLKAQEIFNDPEYQRLFNAVPQTSAGYRQHEEMRRDYTRRVGETRGPKVQAIVAKSFGLSLAGSGPTADSPGAVEARAYQAAIEDPANIDLVVQSTVFTPDGQIDGEATKLKLNGAIATQSAISRAADDARRNSDMANLSEADKLRVRNEGARQVEVLYTPSVIGTMNGAVDIWLSDPNLSAADALAELEQTMQVLDSRVRADFAATGLAASEYSDRIDAIMAPVVALKTMITNNIDNEEKLRKALSSSRAAQVTDLLVETHGLVGSNPNFEKALLESAGSKANVADLSQFLRKNEGGQSVASVTINGLGRGQTISQVMAEETARVASGGEPVVTPEVTRGIVKANADMMDTLARVNNGVIAGGDAQLQTAYMSIAVDGKILTLRDGKGPLQTTYNAKSMTVYENIVGSDDAQAADAVNEFVNMSVKQRSLNLSLARSRATDIGHAVEQLDDGTWVVAETTYDGDKEMDRAMKMGTVPYDPDRRYLQYGKQANYEKLNDIAAQLNYMEGQFTANPKLNELYQAGGEVTGTTASEAGRAAKEITSETGAAPAGYDLSDQVIADLEVAKVNYAADVAREVGAIKPTTSGDTASTPAADPVAVSTASKRSAEKGGVGAMLQSSDSANLNATQLLGAAIKGKESFGGDYDAFNTGEAGNVSKGSQLNGRAVSDYTIGEIMDLQDGGEVFAVGAYQTVPTTLAEAVGKLGLDKNAKFDEATQDRIFEEYLIGAKRPKLRDYVNGSSDDLDAALEELSKEFASFPSVSKGGVSYYDEVGGNEAKVSLDEARQLLETARERKMVAGFEPTGQNIAAISSPEEATKAIPAMSNQEPVNLISIASEFLGMDEVAQKGALSKFLGEANGELDPSEIAWCAGFMNSLLGRAGVDGTSSLMARSFLDWGDESDGQVGDVVVISRGDPNGKEGHVGIFMGYDDKGDIKILGGNQGNAVNVSTYNKSKLLGFRRPPGITSAPGTTDAAAEFAYLAGSQQGYLPTQGDGAITTTELGSSGGRTYSLEELEAAGVDISSLLESRSLDGEGNE